VRDSRKVRDDACGDATSLRCLRGISSRLALASHLLPGRRSTGGFRWRPNCARAVMGCRAAGAGCTGRGGSRHPDKKAQPRSAGFRGTERNRAIDEIGERERVDGDRRRRPRRCGQLRRQLHRRKRSQRDRSAQHHPQITPDISKSRGRLRSPLSLRRPVTDPQVGDVRSGHQLPRRPYAIEAVAGQQRPDRCTALSETLEAKDGHYNISARTAAGDVRRRLLPAEHAAG
jgi:hypothetical protein